MATFHQLALRHWAYAFNWTERAWPTETKETANNKLEQLREELTDGFNQLSSAEPKLILLGDETGRKLLREYGENILCYKTDLILARAISLEKMESYKGDLEMRRTEFFGELSRVYKTL
ncbi:MAG TPA: hypothetical protein VLL54_01765 [Pyrinomonadaceae bacterium]|nr:hypothetical protein [Pyrinomonadaceae bacterium]